MAALAVISYVWNGHGPMHPKRAQVDVEYRNKHGLYRKLVYDVDIEELSAGSKDARVRVGRGDSCKVIARRESTSEGSKITQQHETIHVQGLREEYHLWKKRIDQGRHYNSEKYGDFSGDISNADPKKLAFTSSILHDKRFVPIHYEVDIKSIY